MNRIFRIIFNRNTGRLEVVSELAKSPALGGSGAAAMTDANTASANAAIAHAPKPLSALLMLALGTATLSLATLPVLSAIAQQAPLPPATVTTPPPTQIVADPNAPKHQQPTILPTANNSVQVNIQTPTAAGVSMNQYRQFDVGSNGAILNNSRTNAQTQTAGWIQGNPWLAGGTARIIVNQVNSTDPSKLAGHLEVAGDRAEVIVANAAGIQVDGAGFINASKVTLTSGLPQLGSTGALESYRVTQGHIAIQGGGLNTGDADYTQLLARSMQVNANVWANQLKVVTGTNTVNAQDDTAAPSAIAATGTAPTVALDVGQLGGMYAGKITLIGTEAGLGIRNAGTLAANGGGITIDANGLLRNSGTVAVNGASNALKVRTTDLENAGTLSSQGHVQIAAKNDVINTGLTVAGRELQLQAATLTNRGTVNAQRLDVTTNTLTNSGTLQQTGAQGLDISVGSVTNSNAGHIGTTPMTAGSGDPGSPGPGTPQTGTPPTSSESGGHTQTQTPTPESFATGALRIRDALNNHGGTVSANGDVTLTSQQGVSNTAKSTIDVTQLTVQSGTLDNSGGTLNTQTASLHVEALRNNAGTFATQSPLTLNAQTVENRSGTLSVNGTFDARVSGSLDNRAGVIISREGLRLSAGDADNAQGTLASGHGDVTLTLNGALSNAGGTVQTTQALNVQSNGVNNDGGKLLAGNLQLNAGSAAASNRAGRIAANTISMSTGALDNDAGLIQGVNALTVDTHGQALRNTNSGENGGLHSNGDITLNSADLDSTKGVIAAGHALQITSRNVTNGQGLIASGGALNLHANALSNVDGTVQSNGTATLNVAGDVNNASGVILSKDAFALTARALNNTDGVVGSLDASTNLALSAGMQNRGGTVVSGANLQLASNGFDNTQGTLIAKNLGIDAGSGTLTNTQGRLAGDTLTLRSGDLDNRDGLIQAQTQLTIDASGTVHNAQSKEDDGIRSGGDAAITANAFENGNGDVIAMGALNVTIANPLRNDGGLIAAMKGVTLTGGSLDNAGTIQSATTLKVNVANTANNRGSMLATDTTSITANTIYNNSGGILASTDNDVVLNATTLTNAAGLIAAKTNVTASIDGALNNDRGTLQSGDALALTSRSLSNAAGVIQSGTHLNIDTQGGAFGNVNGTVSSNALNIHSSALNNDGGLLQSATTLNVNASSAELSNSNSGTKGGIRAGGALSITAGNLNNTQGFTASGDTVTLDLTGALNNTGGTVLSANAMNINTASLSNAKGIVAAIDGDLAVTTQGWLDNAQGQLQSNRQVTLTSSGLNNGGGVIAGTATTINTRGQALNNTQGSVAGSTVSIDSGALDNTQGLVHASQSLNVNTHGNALLNRDSGSNAGLISGGTLNVTAGNLDNQRGVIASASTANVLTAALSNTQGLLSTQGDLNLTSQSLTNTDGAILMGGNGEVRITDTLDNAKGLLQGAKTLNVAANTLINANTKPNPASTDPAVALGIAADTLNLTATTIDNSAGILAADADLNVRGTGLLDNSGGDLIGGQRVTITDPTYARTLNNNGGKILAGHSVTIQAKTVQGQGTLASSRDLSLDLKDSLDNRSDLTAAGDLTVRTQGDLSNSAQIIGGNRVTVSATHIDNQASGEIAAANGITDITASGRLTNRGLIDGVLTQVRAGTLNNLGSGRIYGDALAIGATTLNNMEETVNGVTQAGTLAARQNLQLGANAISNRNGALIYSDGDAHIAGALDGNALATGSATTLENRSATIDIAGNLSIAADQIHNIRDGVKITQVQSVDETVNMHLASWQQNGSNSGTLNQSSNYRAWQVMYLDPSQIIETSTVVTPDGYPMGRAVVKLTANTSMFYGAFGGTNSQRNERSRLIPGDGTVTVYYRLREDGQSNPDQVSGGDVPFASLGLHEPGATAYESNTLSYSSNYGTCSTNCVQLLGAYQYSDPYTIIENRIQGSDHFNTEASRIAHHTAVDDVLDPNVGHDAVIRSGGDMAITTHNLRNEYGRIAAGGNLIIRDPAGNTDGIVSNLGASLYRTHSFANISVAYSGGQTAWTRPQLSERIGEVGGSITAGGTLVIDTGTLDNFNGGRDAPNITDPAAFVKKPLGSAPTFSTTGTDTLAGQIHTSDVQTADTPPSIAPTATVTPIVPGTSTPIDATTPQTVTPSGFTILTAPNSGSVAASSLFAVNPNANGHFIETDPRFTNYRSWLSSEWMINALGIDPSGIHKRLGDGYYEQKLIRDQIAQLTGRRFLDGYANDEEQYKALMTAGVTFANQYGLRPGIALSAEQMARLTSDLVWLVEEEVTLPDGTKVKALVPKVYVAVRNGDINPNGALLAGNRIHLNLSGDASNSGDIAGRQLVAINADTIDNLRGANIRANTVLLDAQKDIRNIGSTIKASDAISLNALGNINLQSTTATQSGSGPYSWSQTTVDRTAGLYVTNPNGVGIIALNAGQDIHLIGATIKNAGTNGMTQLNAGGSVNLGTVSTAQRQNYDYDDNNYRRSSSTTEVGTTISGANHVQLLAGTDINSRGGTITSQDGQIALVAGRDVNLLESRNTRDVSGSQTGQKSGVLSSTKTLETWDTKSNTANGTTVSGDRVVVQAGRDLTTRGANVVATNDVRLTAGNNIDIGAAKNHYTDHTITSTSKSGLIGNSLSSITLGSQKTTNERSVDETVHTGSTVGSLQGHVTLDAGNQYTQTGSTVSAPNGDVNISAKSVDIVAAQDTRTETTTDTFKQKGITVAFNSPITGAIEGAINTARDVGKSNDTRVNAMAAANAGYSAYQAGRAVSAPQGGASNGSGGAGGNLSVSITYGQQQSKATSTTTDVTNQGSTVYGNTVNITATGAGEQSRINVIGSDIGSKASTTLKADGDINLLAAQDSTTYTSKNSSQGWNAGVAIAFGNSAGASFGVTAGGNAGRGDAVMDAVTQRNTTVSSDGTTTLISGGTATLKGAQVSGHQVVVNANDLKIESLQDTETYKSDQKNASAQVTVGYGFSASGSYSQSNVKSDYTSVTTQSGILAGDGGYQVNVKNNTDLKGGIVTSTQAAENSNRNSLTTGTLTASDIENRAKYNASGISIGGGIAQNGNGDPGNRTVMNPTSQAQGKASTGVSKAIGFGSDRASQSSTTQSGINTANVTVTDATAQAATGKNVDQIKADLATTTTSDEVAANSGALAKTFDANKVQREIDLQMRVTQEFDANRQQVKAEIYQGMQNKKDDARNIRMANGGYDTAESIALDAEATRLQSFAKWVDLVAMGVLAGPDWGNLAVGGAITQVDLARRAASAPSKVVLQICQAGGQDCVAREVNLEDIQVGSDGKVHVFNNGIFNAEKYALATGAQQNTNVANAQGVYYILNPATGSPVAELFYAAYDKLNDLTNGGLPLTSAEKANQAVIDLADRYGWTVQSVNHSRGGMTWTNAMQDLANQGKKGLPLGAILYNGAAANADEAANLAKVIGSGNTQIYQSTHRTDIVGRWIGGNPATGQANNGTFPSSHSSYTGELPLSGALLRRLTDKNWGIGQYSSPVYVQPSPPKQSSNSKRKVKNDE